MGDSGPRPRLRHYVGGRFVETEPARWVVGTVGPIAVPVATTEDVDEFVTDIGRYLARWTARPAAHRIEVVARLAATLRANREVIAERALSYGMPADVLVNQLEASANAILDVVEQARTRTEPPIGIVAFVLDSNRAGTLMLPKVAEVLVHGGVVVITSSPSLAANSAWMSGVLGGAMPPGTVNEVYGDQETADALITNPLVAAVYADGDDVTVDQLIRLAETHRKLGVAYAR